MANHDPKVIVGSSLVRTAIFGPIGARILAAYRLCRGADVSVDIIDIWIAGFQLSLLALWLDHEETGDAMAGGLLRLDH